MFVHSLWMTRPLLLSSDHMGKNKTLVAKKLFRQSCIYLFREICLYQKDNIRLLTSCSGNTKSLVCFSSCYFLLIVSLTPPHVRSIQGCSFMPAPVRRLL